MSTLQIPADPSFLLRNRCSGLCAPSRRNAWAPALSRRQFLSAAVCALQLCPPSAPPLARPVRLRCRRLPSPQPPVPFTSPAFHSAAGGGDPALGFQCPDFFNASAISFGI